MLCDSRKYVVRLAVGAGLFAGASFASAGVFDAGGDRLANLQNNDGGWDWPLNDGNPANASPVNTVGPIAQGLAVAQDYTGSASQLSALQDAGNLLLNKTNNFSPSDGYLAVTLDSVFGGNTYSSHVKTNFFDKLEAGTYNRNGAGTLHSTASYVNLIRSARSGSQANMAAWDIGIGLYSAQRIGSNTSDWANGVRAELNEISSAGFYDVLGLSGGLLGLASIGDNSFDVTGGDLSSANNLSDLSNILASYQLADGSFTWNSANTGPGNDAVQETAYAILALNEFDRAGYLADLNDAANYLMSAQLATGGWGSYLGDTAGENNEITGEALWGIGTVVPEPSAFALLGLGAGALLLRRRRQRN